MLFLLGIGAVVTIVLRNKAVYEFRSRLLDRISQVNSREIGESKQWIVRYDVLNSIGYNAMMCQFWRPLRSFYVGTILEELAKEI